VNATLQVVLTARAARETRTALVWWREHRPAAPRLLARERRGTLALLALLASAPGLGALARDTRLAGVRRALLPRSRYHVYYRVDAGASRLEVLALWHTRRRAPRL
jgi:plasmid stabilization system protein ParE